MTDLYIEAIEDKQEWSYGIPLEILNSSKSSAINIKFDSGASYTIVAASALFAKLTDSAAECLNRKLSEREYSRTGCGSENTAPFQKKFKAVTGDTLTGYLSDAGEVKLGKVKLSHFYYYFVPQNKRPVALLGNDFLRYCEYTHTIEGNIHITKMDEDAYARHYVNAMSSDELAAVIDEIKQDNADDFGNR